MPFLGTGIIVLIVQFACAAHVVRTGRSYLWIVPIVLLPLLGCLAYFLFAVVPDMAGGGAGRRFADNVANAADPGRAYREKKRQVEQVGSAQSKRELAEECLKRGRFQDAVDLYTSAMDGPLGGEDPALTRGLARARLLAGDGAGAEESFRKLKAIDPVAFDEDAELDFTRALALQGKNDEALAQYESLVPRYAGQEARCRYGLLLEQMGLDEKAQQAFHEIVNSVQHAPRQQRSREREWAQIARQHLRK